MKKWMLSLLIVTTPAAASLRPIASVGLGLDFADFRNTQNIVLLAPFANTYLSTGSDNEPVGNLFLGFEAPLSPNLFGQLGISYYQTNHLGVDGSVYQFTASDMDNLYYYFKINSRRLLLEGKLFTSFHNSLHPYVSIGFGKANNHSYQYQEQGITSADVPMQYAFANRTYHSFAYTVGIGLDYDLTENMRIGGNYRLSGIGDAGLGTIPLQDSSSTIHYANLRLNEFSLQLTLLG